MLTPLSRAARAPAADAERAVITAERHLVDATAAGRAADVAVTQAESAVRRASAGQGDAAFAQTDRAYKVQLAEKRRLEVILATKGLALARARHELAKAEVVDDNSLPEAVDLDLEDFRQAVEDAADEVAAARQDVDRMKVRVAILKKAVHSARVTSLQRGR